MSIQVYAASTIVPLAKQLANSIKNNGKSVFYSDFIVSSNNVMTQWLKVVIAEENGIAANLVANSAKEMLSIVHKIIGGKEQNKLVLNSLQQKWIIYELLNESSFFTKFPSVANYYLNKPSYRLALADKVSTLFDQYALYMPSTMEAWNIEEFQRLGIDEEWQQHLWRAFQEKINTNFLDDYQLFQFIKLELKKPEKIAILKEKLPSIYVFNISNFNTYLLELFIEIGKVIEVEIFYASAIREVKESYNNDLVQNLKGNSAYILDAYNNKNIPIIWLDEVIDKSQNSLLGSLKKAIIKDLKQTALHDADSSVIINSCYSSFREVEVLYNYLVKSIDSSCNGIGARDIVVYCSDIAIYAPAIYAVFENAPYSFPYHIIGQKEQNINSSLNALEAIINIDVRWMKPSAVMQLLEYTSIIQKYQIEDVAFLRKLVSEANIRNGFSGDTYNETNLISWEHGLKRLCYGMLISGEEWFTDGNDDYLVIDKVEGSNSNDLVRFNYLVHNLHTFLLELDKERTIANWVLFLDDGFDLFFDRENDFNLEELTREFSAIEEVASLDEEIAFATIYPILQKVFENNDSTNRVTINKGIRFCSISDAKPIPSAIVALLGLNFANFPRQQKPLSYDLIQLINNSVLQDVKEKDKTFFLEAILSAKQQLYISYIGKSSKDNSEFPPSSVVDTLLDYLEINELVTNHPLHNFNSKYFEGSPEFYSYLGENNGVETVENIFDKDKTPVEDKRKIIDISLHEFINFFKDSFKCYYNKQLGIYYGGDEEALEDSELFENNTLQKWALKKMMVDKRTLSPLEMKALKVKGKLPLGAYGEICLENIQEKIKPLTDKILELRNGFEEEKRKINYEINILGVLYKVKGEIDSVFTNGTEKKYIYSNVSSSQHKYQFEAFMHLLFLNNKEKIQLEYVSDKFSKTIIYSAEFNDILDQLITVFVNSKSNFNPFYINENVNAYIVNADSNEVTQEIVETAFEMDSYLSTYVRKEMETNYFNEMANNQIFVKNCQLLNELIFINFN